MMKKSILFFTSATALLTVISVVSFKTELKAKPVGVSGVSGATATCSNCHRGILNKVDNGSTAKLSSDIPAEGYTPGKEYNMALTIYSQKPKGGFNLRAQNALGEIAGSFGTVSSNAQITTIDTENEVPGELTHKGPDITGGKKEITFKWTAPEAGTGDVSYYGVVATGINRALSIDSLNKLKVVFKENTVTTVDDETSKLALFSVYPTNVKDNFTVTYSLSLPSEVNICVYDVKGRVALKVYQGSEASGTYQKAVSTGEMEAGTYVVRTQINGQNKVVRIVVNK